MGTLRPQHRRPRGYTLLEVLLALAILGLVAGVALPSALRMYADGQLTDAGEAVRHQLSLARSRAIETGERFQFRYEPDGRHGVVVPWEADLANDPERTSGGAQAAVLVSSVTLAEGLRFVSVENAPATGGSTLNEQLFAGLPNATELAGVAWSTPILFAGDGSAIDAAWMVVDGRGQGLRVEVRGLTGVATVSTIQPYEER
jgi:prepilin-type N-terminal cleavage/methylation domain-containing protein